MRNRVEIEYRNEKYGFTLRFPGWWRNYCTVNRAKQDRETEYEVHFKFKYKGKIYEDLFAVLVYRMTKEEWVDQGYEDSPVTFIAEYESRVFGYITPEELPYAFYDDRTGDYNYKAYGTAIELLKRMVNQDVPRIIQSIRFPRKTMTMKSIPYRIRKVWPGGTKPKR
ncbi:hypothetical protein [Paenibacillus cremeus]|uniref:Uncharacterized protein n=1 Tax=Paenibacillus cremeus TaxID=2163881 RepID=A0A559K8I2_9BACL|nr:hypothetical protein [Paenibacillus cremeus]TVY08440.1 hypothetical protein FPZ49_18565 [Paenibacillus cremeus]